MFPHRFGGVFMLGKSSVQNTLGMINFMPTTILISKVAVACIRCLRFLLVEGDMGQVLRFSEVMYFQNVSQKNQISPTV